LARTTILAFTFLAALALPGCRSIPHQRVITIKFDYDFSATPACSSTVTRNCVQHFNLYDITFGVDKRKRIAWFPVEAGAKGRMYGITYTTKPIPLESRQYRLGVAAQMPNGVESDVGKCTTSVQSQ